MSRLSRRSLLRHAGLAALFSPFLALFDDRPARAAAGKAKYVLVFFTNGTEPAVWSPRGSSDSNIVFSSMTEPLAPIKSNLILVEKLSSFGSASSHGAPGGLTGMNYGPPTHISVEQFISDGLRKAGIRTQIPNLLLGGVPNEQLTTFYRDGKALAPIANPVTAYQAVFSGAGGDTSGPDPDPAVVARLQRRKSVLDQLNREVKQLSDMLGNQEREKLERHAASLRQLEERLAQQENPGSGEVIKPVACSKGNTPASAPTPLENSVVHLDVAINAFACDITRVAAVQFGHHQNTQVSIPEVGAPGDWHNGFLHSDNPRTRLVNLERWLCKQFVAAAEKLKSLPAPDGSGTLWDQTLMIWARDMGDAVIHDGSDMRFVLAGGAGGYLKTSANGRYIQGNGQHHQTVLLNVCEAMGITDFTGFGDPGAARMPLSGIAA